MDIRSELASLQRIGDRLASTSNEDLQKVLQTLLPKLLPLSNTDELRDKQVIPILMQVLKRIKQLQTPLPMEMLIGLIRPDMLPYCCNLSTVFVDAGTKWHRSEQWSTCAKPLLVVLGNFVAFSSQSNALCYYALFCLRSFSTEVTSESNAEAMIVLGDWLIDFSIAQPGIVKDSAGSIQPGLSVERLGRIVSKKPDWSATDMKQFKMNLVDSLSKPWLPTPCSIGIAIILSCDSDSDVALQAVFKMNGARSIFPDINANPYPVLNLLLTLCLPLTQAMQSSHASPYVRHRTALRITVKCAILRWICKEMQETLIVAAKNVIQLVVTEILKPSDGGVDDMTYSSLVMEMTALLTERMPDEALGRVAALLLQCVKKVLQPFSSFLSSSSASSSDSEAGISTRESCYRVVDKIARSCPLVASADAELLVLLFGLLDFEDNRAIIRLYTALGGLRLAYTCPNLKADGVTPGRIVHSSLGELISRTRTSSEPKKRLAGVQWARALFNWSPLVLETLMLLADDSNESVAQAVAVEFASLRTTVYACGMDTASVPNHTEHHVGVDVDAVGSSDDPPSTQEERIMNPLSDILDLLSSPLLFYPVAPPLKNDVRASESDVSDDCRRLRPIATEELLHTAATGIMRLVESYRGYSFYAQHFLQSDPWPTTSSKHLESFDSLQLNAVVNAKQLCSLISTIGTILTAASSAKISNSASGLNTTGAKGALWSRLALEAAVKTSQVRGILTAAVDTLHKSLLISSDEEVLEASRKLLPQLLSCLSNCYSDASDPLCLSFSSDDVLNHGQLSSQQHTRIFTVKDGLTAARGTGSFRNNLGQTLALSCQNASDNYIQNLRRVLTHKLSKRSVQRETPTGKELIDGGVADVLSEGDVILVAGAVTALGFIAQALTAWEGELSITDAPHSNSRCEVSSDVIHRPLLDTLISIQKLDASCSTELKQPLATETHPPRNVIVDLKVVALRTLKVLAASGLLTSSTKKKSELAIDTVSTSSGESLHSSKALEKGDVIPTSHDVVEIVLFSLISIVRNYGLDEVSKVSATKNDRSSPSSKVVAASIDVLSTACLSCTSEEFFWSVWELFLFFKPSRTETPLLRFALAEGIVRMSTAPMSRHCPPNIAMRLTMVAEENGHCDPSSEASTDSIGKSSRLPFLTRVLLDKIESAVSGTPQILALIGQKGVVTPPSPATFDKITAGMLLLVLVSQSTRPSNIVESDANAENESPHVPVLPKREIIRGTELFLLLLREKDAFLQDVSCAGLCYLYHCACRHVEQPSSPASIMQNGTDKSLSEIIGREVIATLTREKRGLQAAGVAVAGESTSTSSEGDMARTLEALLNPATTEGEEGETRDPVSNGRGGGNGGGGAVAGGGGGAPAPVDALAAATAAAALELGLSPEAVAAVTRHGTQGSESSENGYGVYTTACRVAKKTGDPSVVFAVLALIQRDPSFGVGETTALRFNYQAPIAHIEISKAKNLIPSLFLAKHDPSPPVKALMKQLWDTLIVERGLQKLLIASQNGIIKYLCLSLGSKQWREREAACTALESFLPLRPWVVVRLFGHDLWNAGMAVLDDVRESTRIAAIGFMKVLSDHVTRACNKDESGSSITVVDDAIAFVMPLLLDRGLCAPSQEARGFTLGVLVKLIKSSRSALKEWLVRLVSVLVESMSALEPKTLQYMQFHTARLQINDEELENMRVRLSRQSPMQEALDACLHALEQRPEDVPEAARALRSQLLSGVGLATRVAAVQSLAYLADNMPGELGITENGSKAFRTVVDSLVNSPSMQISLKKFLLGGLGSLSKVVNADVLANEVAKLITRYETLDRDDCSEATVIASCLLQIVNRAGDRLLDDSAWSRLIACTYVGTSDTNPEAQEVWSKLWPEVLSGSATGTKSAALLRVLPIIIKLLCTLLSDLAWDKRKQAVAVIADLMASLPSQHISSHLGSIVEALLRSIPGQIWSGQAIVLETVATIVTKCFPSGSLDFSLSVHSLLVVRHSVSAEKESSESRVKAVQDTPADVRYDDILTVKDAIIKKTVTPSGSDAMQLDTTEIALRIEMFQDASTLPLGQTTTLTEERWKGDTDGGTWTLSLRGLISLLLHETKRGDREYRLSAAKALSNLPWAIISSNPKGRRVFKEYVAVFACLGGVRPPVTLSDMSSSAGDHAVVTAVDKQDLRGDKRKRHQTNSAMFGSRYGIEFKDTRLSNALRRISPTTSSPPPNIGHAGSSTEPMSASDEAETTDLIVQSDAMTSSEVFINHTNEQAEIRSAQSSHQNQDSELAPVQDMSIIVNNAVESVPQESLPVILIGSSTAVPVDPAFRVKMMECVSRGWPHQSTGNTASDFPCTLDLNTTLWTQIVAEPEVISVTLDGLIAWAASTIESGEVWSIRVGSLQILGAVLSTYSADGNRKDCDEVYATVSKMFLVAIRVLSIAMSDKKHSKVRIAALLCLNKILAGVGCRAYLIDREDVRVILRLAASDPEPAVLEAASKAQLSWLALCKPIIHALKTST